MKPKFNYASRCALIMAMISMFGCLDGGKSKDGDGEKDENNKTPKLSVEVKAYNVDVTMDFLRVFSGDHVWLGSRSTPNTVGYFVNDAFVVLDKSKFGKRFDNAGKVTVDDIINDNLGNVYFGATGGAYSVADIMMLKKSGIANPEDDANWHPIKHAGNTAGDPEKLSADSGSLFQSMSSGHNNDVLFASAMGIDIGKADASGPVFYDGTTRRQAKINWTLRIVPVNFGGDNDYLLYSDDVTSKDKYIYSLSKTLTGAKQTLTSSFGFGKTSPYAAKSMKATNNKNAAWLASNNNDKLARIVAKTVSGATHIGLSEQLTHASVGLASSPVVSFAAIGSTTWVLLKNGKLYFVDEVGITQDGDNIINANAVRFTQATIADLTLSEGLDLESEGTTLWVLGKGEAFRIKNADVASKKAE